MKVALISLGCPKNRVDAEVILGLLGEAGYCLTQFPEEADIIIINTCSFISSARIEAKRSIEKNANGRHKLIVCGCLPQMTREKLFNDYPYIDAIVGSAEFYKLPEIVSRLLNGEQRIVEIGEPTFIYNSITPRLLSTPVSYAYLKIAEGCSNCCSYCRIPDLRGAYRSREIKDIINEANMLVELGVKELILIAQDTTNFGADKVGTRNAVSLQVLLEKLDKFDNLQWVRLLYTHPAHFTDSLISVMSESKKLCKYIDIPLQHTHPEMLNRMGRPKWEGTRELLSKLKSKGFALRTTFLVGFPGEKEYHFDRLLKDVKEIEFDWVGAFTYSQEEGTCASKLANQVSEEIKKERLERLLESQLKITKQKNKQRIGKTLQVLVDTAYTGHTEFQAPDLDGKVVFKKKVVPGKFLQSKVKRIVQEYDLEV
ncbi:MAG: 30S ribosomal protein S12 methylthiotransferase RimO [Candidatus Stahlbacteria bacterium]|nr:30S ribosomal protein S12 methylthiotransferase RimO [Candidatus Stahlbacteria bacterium]